MLRWVGAVAAVVILIALLGIWRMMQGPIELNWLTPYVQAAIERSGVGLKVAISGVRFEIDRTTHQFDLRAEDVRVSLPDGRPLASFPELATSFALGALLRGRLGPTQVVVERPVLHLIRAASGAISARIGSGDNDAAHDLDPHMLEQLAGPPQRDAPLGLVRRISIRGATVIVDDRRSGRTWHINRADFSVSRSTKGASGDVSFAVPIGTSTPEVHASYRYLAERQILDLDLAIDGVEPTAIPPLIPELAQLSHVEAPVSGTLRTRIDLKQGTAQGSRLDLALGKGLLHSDWLPTGSIPIEQGELRATYAPEAEEVRVASLALDLGGGTKLNLDGTLGGVTPALLAAPENARPPGHVAGKFAATLTHVPVGRLANLWPKAFSPGGRRWTLANIADGVLDEAAMHLALDLDPVAHSANVLSAHGELRFHDLTITYLDGLPPVRKVAGTGAFAGDHLDFTPTGGTLRGLTVTGGSLRLTELGTPTEWLTVDLALAGPLQDVLGVIDAKPLHYAKAIGLDPAHVGGRTETQLHFKLPMLAGVRLSEVDYSATATITGASIGNVLLGRGVTQGNLALDLSRAGAHLQGTARFDDTPAKLDAKVAFAAGTGPRAVYRAAMTLDDAARQRLGFDVAPDRLHGPVAVDATYTQFAARRAEATALVDLRGAALAIPEAGWKKLPGRPAAAKIVLDLVNDRITGISQIDLIAAGLDGKFAVRLNGDHKQVERIDIRRLAVGDTDLAGTVSRRPGGGWRADIRSARADVTHLLKDATDGAAVLPTPESPPLAVNARIDRLVLGPRRELQKVSAELLRTGGIWQSGRIEGAYANGRKISLSFGEGGSHRVTLRSDDLGATLKLLDIADNIVGGRVTLDGQLSQNAGKRILRAHIDGKDYVIVRAPVLARILALPSLTGFASMLSGGGLPFTTLRGDIVVNGSRIELTRMLAFGEALGITADGWVDSDSNRLDLRGTLAPAYALNSILGNVPIIGPLLGGGSQGLFAANFRLSGPSADPQVTVNPLSALAPGFLRQLFAPIVGVAPPRAEATP